MSAAQPKSSEPSMEEILASIRRIIADEPVKPPAPPAPANAPAPAAATPPVPLPAAADDEEVMDLTPRPRIRTPEPHFITDDPVDNDLSFADPHTAKPKSQDDIDALMNAAMEAEVAPPAPVATAAPVPVASSAPAATPAFAPAPVAERANVPAERLISADTDRATSAAFSSLANTILTRNARTLDDLMQEMMRPMIKNWLDDNLPTVVERLVRAEIERVSRGGR